MPFKQRRGKQIGHYKNRQLVLYNAPYNFSSREKDTVSHSQAGTWRNLKRNTTKVEPEENKNQWQ